MNIRNKVENAFNDLLIKPNSIEKLLQIDIYEAKEFAEMHISEHLKPVKLAPFLPYQSR